MSLWRTVVIAIFYVDKLKAYWSNSGFFHIGSLVEHLILMSFLNLHLYIIPTDPSIFYHLIEFVYSLFVETYEIARVLLK